MKVIKDQTHRPSKNLGKIGQRKESISLQKCSFGLCLAKCWKLGFISNNWRPWLRQLALKLFPWGWKLASKLKKTINFFRSFRYHLSIAKIWTLSSTTNLKASSDQTNLLFESIYPQPFFVVKKSSKLRTQIWRPWWSEQFCFLRKPTSFWFSQSKNGSN